MSTTIETSSSSSAHRESKKLEADQDFLSQLIGETQAKKLETKQKGGADKNSKRKRSTPSQKGSGKDEKTKPGNEDNKRKRKKHRREFHFASRIAERYRTTFLDSRLGPMAKEVSASLQKIVLENLSLNASTLKPRKLRTITLKVIQGAFSVLATPAMYEEMWPKCSKIVYEKGVRDAKKRNQTTKTKRTSNASRKQEAGDSDIRKIIVKFNGDCNISRRAIDAMKILSHFILDDILQRAYDFSREKNRESVDPSDIRLAIRADPCTFKMFAGAKIVGANHDGFVSVKFLPWHTNQKGKQMQRKSFFVPTFAVPESMSAGGMRKIEDDMFARDKLNAKGKRGKYQDEPKERKTDASKKEPKKKSSKKESTKGSKKPEKQQLKEQKAREKEEKKQKKDEEREAKKQAKAEAKAAKEAEKQQKKKRKRGEETEAEEDTKKEKDKEKEKEDTKEDAKGDNKTEPKDAAPAKEQEPEAPEPKAKKSKKDKEKKSKKQDSDEKHINGSSETQSQSQPQPQPQPKVEKQEPKPTEEEEESVDMFANFTKPASLVTPQKATEVAAKKKEESDEAETPTGDANEEEEEEVAEEADD